MRRTAALLLLTAAFTAAQSDEATIRALEDKWDAAVLKQDADLLSSLLDDRFIATEEGGVVRSKAEIVGAIRAGDIRYSSAKTEEMKVILHSPDAAVVNGRWRGTYTYKGRRTSLHERFTSFWLRRNGQWKCVGVHGTAIQ